LCACLLQGSDFSGSKLVGSQFARATARGAVMKGTDLSDTNCFGTSFDGADLEVGGGCNAATGQRAVPACCGAVGVTSC
jgi:hypothetical protein